MNYDYKFVIVTRILREVCTDPMRRCYYGVFAKSEMQWSDWFIHEYVKEEDIERRLQFWRELNDYAVSQRGENGKSEYKVVSIEEAKNIKTPKFRGS